MQDDAHQIDLGLGRLGVANGGTVGERFDASGGRLSAGDVEEFWSSEMDPGERAARQAEITKTVRWQNAGAVAGSIRSAALVVRQNKRKALLGAAAVVTLPGILAAGGVAALGVGAAAAVGGAAYGGARLRRSIQQGNQTRRTIATERAQLDAVRQHLSARQSSRRSSGEPAKGIPGEAPRPVPAPHEPASGASRVPESSTRPESPAPTTSHHTVSTDATKPPSARRGSRSDAFFDDPVNPDNDMLARAETRGRTE